jgi:hypothetical protein
MAPYAPDALSKLVLITAMPTARGQQEGDTSVVLHAPGQPPVIPGRPDHRLACGRDGQGLRGPHHKDAISRGGPKDRCKKLYFTFVVDHGLEAVE